jgi:formiminotetrahydrofolate cyclodeaminase
MVGSFTAGKAKFVAVEAEVTLLLEQLQGLRERLLELTDADAEAYALVGAAYGMAKGCDEEKAARKAAIQEALKAAAQVPLGVVRAAGEVALLLPTMAELGNPNLLSDVGVAAILAPAALEAGRLNVEVNLAGVTDEGFKAAARAQIGAAEEQVAVARKVAAEVLAKIAAQ